MPESSYDTGTSVWNCPACSYDLQAIADGLFVRCPECGRKWSVAWLIDRPDTPPPRRRWVLMPLTGMIMTTGASAAQLFSGRHPGWVWPLVWCVVWIWTLVCWTIALDRSARPRLGDMAPVIAVILAAGPAIAWTFVCVVWGRMVQG